MRRLTLLAFAFCPLTFADEPPPLDMGALARGFALPAQGRPEVLAAGAVRQRVYLNDTNEYTARSNSIESVVIDGEATQLSYDLRYGFADRWEANLFVPVLAQGGGILDPVIQGWHRLWGLPNGGRENAPKDRYLYQYSRNNKTLLDVRQGSVGFGDVQLGGGYRLADHLAARAMLQLPTGDASHLAGNGAFGGALWLDGGLPLEDFFNWLTIYGSLGYSYTATGDVLREQQKNSLAFGAAGLGFRFTPRWDAKVQVYFHAAPYKNSTLGALDHIAAPLTVSTSYRITPKTALSLGFQEKANIFASPDFGVFLGMAFD